MRRIFIFVIALITAVQLAFPSGAFAADSAQKAQDSAAKQKKAQAAAMIMAAMMAAMCNQPPGNVAPCIMAALAAAQAGSLGGTAAGAQSNAMQNSTSGGSATTAPTPPSPGAGGTGTSISEVKKALEKAGAKISEDGKTITLPDGKKVALDGAGTDAGLKSAGLTDKQIADGKLALTEAQAQLGKTKSPEVSVDGGGGGGGSAYAGPSTSGGAPGPRKKANVSGLSKNFGGDKIGVAADNIFEMITRRYKAKDAEETFIKN